MCGAAVMIVEILGAKMLAPYFGTSHFVWTSQIAVTLISLSLGYYFGGLLVDRDAEPSRLFALIFTAAVYLSLTVPPHPAGRGGVLGPQPRDGIAFGVGISVPGPAGTTGDVRAVSGSRDDGLAQRCR